MNLRIIIKLMDNLAANYIAFCYSSSNQIKVAFLLELILTAVSYYSLEMLDSASAEPPLESQYLHIKHSYSFLPTDQSNCQAASSPAVEVEFEVQLPVIDLEAPEAAIAIREASSKWGFFQVVSHGISGDLLQRMRKEQVKLFSKPFEKKSNSGLLGNSYRWGSIGGHCAANFSWNEAFHVPLNEISNPTFYGEMITLREVMMEFSMAMSKLARSLIEILRDDQIQDSNQWPTPLNCDDKTCFLRLNRYPSCPISDDMLGLVPHTDSDILTILYQDEVGGLQLLRDSKWVTVRPNLDTLIVNIGDLLQALSNDRYKSIEHRVVANQELERYSIAYFLCPSLDSVISSGRQAPVYRDFTFGEYRAQVRRDVNMTGQKVGLPRFRVAQD
ncbi:hypothetical protein MLD38_028651 [Melastoma candidum]|uniref:Uncharacterized protein n=1 Tax=Melastoma candidum TaxID=119954 RepID=A0ACB9N3V6_9MYRT|nr:hypothetical protein MLD38_028651 [Melastoma candidum]